MVWVFAGSHIDVTDKLGRYRAKRDTSRSGEPDGERATRGDAGGPRFVVQRHAASSLHFDFRLEIEGVLVSWAVPKGPSTDPRDKRLAARTEDHPLDYAGFEGRIEDGYGAGTVIVWDTGSYRNLDDDHDLVEGLERGHLKVELHGQKLAGGYALTQTRTGGEEKNWLLVKVDDSDADRRRRPATAQPESVLSGKHNEDL
jgi:DNA ligase D-like protein (predicted 3'-phosphoesterase)